MSLHWDREKKLIRSMDTILSFKTQRMYVKLCIVLLLSNKKKEIVFSLLQKIPHQIKLERKRNKKQQHQIVPLPRPRGMTGRDPPCPQGVSSSSLRVKTMRMKMMGLMKSVHLSCHQSHPAVKIYNKWPSTKTYRFVACKEMCIVSVQDIHFSVVLVWGKYAGV